MWCCFPLEPRRDFGFFPPSRGCSAEQQIGMECERMLKFRFILVKKVPHLCQRVGSREFSCFDPHRTHTNKYYSSLGRRVFNISCHLQREEDFYFEGQLGFANSVTITQPLCAMHIHSPDSVTIAHGGRQGPAGAGWLQTLTTDLCV